MSFLFTLLGDTYCRVRLSGQVQHFLMGCQGTVTQLYPGCMISGSGWFNEESRQLLYSRIGVLCAPEYVICKHKI